MHMSSRILDLNISQRKLFKVDFIDILKYKFALANLFHLVDTIFTPWGSLNKLMLNFFEIVNQSVCLKH